MLREDAAFLAVDPQDSQHVIAAGKVSVGSLFCMGVYRSMNGGLNWTSTRVHNETGSAGHVVAFDPSTARMVYAGGETLAGGPLLYRSLDGGTTWAMIAGPFTKGIRAIAMNPLAGEEIYVGTANGFWRSKDRGVSWRHSPEIMSALTIVLNDGDPRKIFCGGEKGVFYSADKGASWKNISAGLKTRKVKGLLVNFALRILLVGTDGGGICKRAF